jgi:hypothetical protein
VLQSYLSPFIGHQMAWHTYMYIYFPKNVKKKMLIAKKYFPFQGLSREKAGLARVSIAKKNHSSLLRIQTVRDHTCLPQAGTSDIGLMPAMICRGSTEKSWRTLQVSNPVYESLVPKV